MQATIPFPNIGPELFSISLFGMDFALRWYALAYIVGIILGWRLAVQAVKNAGLWPRDQAPLTVKQVEDLLTWVIIGVIIGGRLGYVLFYDPAFYLANPSQIPVIWRGGMAFHGGFLGVIAAIYFYSRTHSLRLWSVADMMALGTPPGLLLGRLANFINAELWGRPTDMPWGVVFPGEAAQACGDALTICARHPSQLYESLLEGLILGTVMIWLVWRRGALKLPGRIAGTFFLGYGAARFFVEFFRQPDAQFVAPGNPLGLAYHINGVGLTMGQTLSLPMILIGLYLILTAKRRALG